MTKAITINELKTPRVVLVIVLAVFTVLTWVFANDIYGPDSVFNKNLFGNEALNGLVR